MKGPRYPAIVVALSGQSAFPTTIVGRVCIALLDHGVSNEEVDEFRDDAYSDGFGHLLRVVTEWVNVE